MRVIHEQLRRLGSACRTSPERSTPRAPREGDARLCAGLFPFRSHLLRESRLVSFPPLINMLKLGGSSPSTRGRRIQQRLRTTLRCCCRPGRLHAHSFACLLAGYRFALPSLRISFSQIRASSLPCSAAKPSAATTATFSAGGSGSCVLLLMLMLLRPLPLLPRAPPHPAVFLPRLLRHRLSGGGTAHRGPFPSRKKKRTTATGGGGGGDGGERVGGVSKRVSWRGEAPTYAISRY